MSFLIESRVLDNDVSVGPSGVDCSLGRAFTLRSVVTGKYVVVSGSQRTLKVTGTKADAALFTFLGAGSETSDACTFKLLYENRILKLRGKDETAYVSMSEREADVLNE